jgi:hypothetical protein
MRTSIISIQRYRMDCNGFSTYRLFAAYQTAARLYAGLTEAAIRLSERLWLTSTNDLRDSEHRSSWSRQSASQHLPGSVFDARYKGLTGHAARLDASICRQERLR